MKKYVFFIGGPAQHGKTTVSKHIAEVTALSRGSTSDHLYELLATIKGISVADLQQYPKEEIRPELIALGKHVCRFNKATLVIQLMEKGVRVIDGLRSLEEVTRATEAARLFGFTPITIWVQSSVRPILSDVGDLSAKNMNVSLVNDGTLDELYKQIDVKLSTPLRTPCPSIVNSF